MARAIRESLEAQAAFVRNLFRFTDDQLNTIKEFDKCAVCWLSVAEYHICTRCIKGFCRGCID